MFQSVPLSFFCYFGNIEHLTLCHFPYNSGYGLLGLYTEVINHPLTKIRNKLAAFVRPMNKWDKSSESPHPSLALNQFALLLPPQGRNRIIRKLQAPASDEWDRNPNTRAAFVSPFDIASLRFIGELWTVCNCFRPFLRVGRRVSPGIWSEKKLFHHKIPPELTQRSSSLPANPENGQA